MLDDQLGGLRDIVDTVPYVNGQASFDDDDQLTKILLGGVLRWIDNDEKR